MQMCEGAGVFDQAEHGVGGDILHEPLWGGVGVPTTQRGLPRREA
jgi:hypothetical protein